MVKPFDLCPPVFQLSPCARFMCTPTHHPPPTTHPCMMSHRHHRRPLTCDLQKPSYPLQSALCRQPPTPTHLCMMSHHVSVGIPSSSAACWAAARRASRIRLACGGGTTPGAAAWDRPRKCGSAPGLRGVRARVHPKQGRQGSPEDAAPYRGCMHACVKADSGPPTALPAVVLPHSQRPHQHLAPSRPLPHPPSPSPHPACHSLTSSASRTVSPSRGDASAAASAAAAAAAMSAGTPAATAAASCSATRWCMDLLWAWGTGGRVASM